MVVAIAIFIDLQRGIPDPYDAPHMASMLTGERKREEEEEEERKKEGGGEKREKRESESESGEVGNK